MRPKRRRLMEKYYFVDGEEVDRQVFEETWGSEGFGATHGGRWYPVPPPTGYGRWQGIHEYRIRPVRRWEDP